MPTFSTASAARLATCDPRLQKILSVAIQSIDFTILEGHRDQAAQEKAFAEGKSKLHYPDGKHNASPSRAVDIAPWYSSAPSIDWKDLPAFARLMGYIQRVAEEQGIKLRFGLDWDGDYRTIGDESFIDAPHLELNEP